MAEKNAGRDFRLLVLLILAAIICVVSLPASWLFPASGRQAASYYYVPAVQGKGPEIIRIPQDQKELPMGALAITPDLPCGNNNFKFMCY